MFKIPESATFLPRCMALGIQGSQANQNDKPPVGPLNTKRQRYEGICKFYDPVRFWGFIERRGEKDLFVHGNELLSSGITELTKGQRVSFEIKKTGTKLKATNIMMC